MYIFCYNTISFRDNKKLQSIISHYALIPNQNSEKLFFPQIIHFAVFASSLIRSCFEIAIVFEHSHVYIGFQAFLQNYF